VTNDSQLDVHRRKPKLLASPARIEITLSIVEAATIIDWARRQHAEPFGDSWGNLVYMLILLKQMDYGI